MIEQIGQLPAFLAIEGNNIDPTQLSPKIMKWNNESWLLDMGVCRNYWQTQAFWQKMTPQEILRALFKKTAGDTFRAVFADTPWQAVLLLEYMRERSLVGLVNRGEQFGHRLYQQVSWSAWTKAAQDYGRHAKAAKTTRFNETIFRRQLKLLLASTQRLSQRRPFHLAAATVPAIKRRFGAHLALLWEWTMKPKENSDIEGVLFPLAVDDVCFISGFPWLTWTRPQKPTVTRHLEYPLWQWDHLQPLLVQDFDRLCQADGWDQELAITHVIWNLTFDDTSVSQVDIRFRHPHALQKEIGKQSTATLQSAYAFHAKFRPHQDHYDDLCPPKPIIGWQIIVEASMLFTPALHDLFGSPTGDVSSTRYMQVENQLPVPVQRYALACDWLPESSFQKAHANDPRTSWEPWLSIARRRPLYIYKEPITRVERLRRADFLERTAVKWWKTDHCADDLRERDYFILEDSKGKWRWGFKNPEGKWYIHGVFG